MNNSKSREFNKEWLALVQEAEKYNVPMPKPPKTLGENVLKYSGWVLLIAGVVANVLKILADRDINIVFRVCPIIWGFVVLVISNFMYSKRIIPILKEEIEKAKSK